jgi:hypothetical protein
VQATNEGDESNKNSSPEASQPSTIEDNKTENVETNNLANQDTSSDQTKQPETTATEKSAETCAIHSHEIANDLNKPEESDKSIESDNKNIKPEPSIVLVTANTDNNASENNSGLSQTPTTETLTATEPSASETAIATEISEPNSVTTFFTVTETVDPNHIEAESQPKASQAESAVTESNTKPFLSSTTEEFTEDLSKNDAVESEKKTELEEESASAESKSENVEPSAPQAVVVDTQVELANEKTEPAEDLAEVKTIELSNTEIVVPSAPANTPTGPQTTEINEQSSAPPVETSSPASAQDEKASNSEASTNLESIKEQKQENDGSTLPLEAESQESTSTTKATASVETITLDNSNVKDVTTAAEASKPGEVNTETNIAVIETSSEATPVQINESVSSQDKSPEVVESNQDDDDDESVVEVLTSYEVVVDANTNEVISVVGNFFGVL